MTNINTIESPIEFSINKLFGIKDVKILIKHRVTIFVGENGIGKTTILNILYYTLKCDFKRLRHYNFESISLKSESGYVEIFKDQLSVSKKIDENGIQKIIDLASDQETEWLLDYISKVDVIWSNKVKARRKNISADTDYFYKYREFMPYIINKINQEKTQIIQKIIGEYSGGIEYFPTYRRIEDEIQNLGFSQNLPSKKVPQLIKFGMQDVINIINEKRDEIKNKTILEFHSLTGQLLKQYTDILPTIKDDDLKKIQPSVLSIIFDRLKDNVSEDIKKEIINRVKKRHFFKDMENNKYLLNYLLELVKIYEKQKKLDDTLRQFAEKCDKYLTHKKYYYDESKVEVSLYDEYSKEPLDLSLLSSGEKQIVSIFSRIYLEKEKPTIVLLDEPELSLSIEWQKTLIPDIAQSENCGILIVTTHSPFIFDNLYDRYTYDLDRFIKID